MDKDELKTIESKLLIKLPQDYVKIILDYPKALLDKKSLGLHPNDEGPDKLQLLNNPNEIIKKNLYERKSDWETDVFKWKRSYFLIGIDGTGGKYYLDLNDISCKVYFYHISDDEIRIYSESMNDFVNDLIEFIKDVNLGLE